MLITLSPSSLYGPCQLWPKDARGLLEQATCSPRFGWVAGERFGIPYDIGNLVGKHFKKLVLTRAPGKQPRGNDRLMAANWLRRGTSLPLKLSVWWYAMNLNHINVASRSLPESNSGKEWRNAKYYMVKEPRRHPRDIQSLFSVTA